MGALRSELEGLGRLFRTRSDTEVCTYPDIDLHLVTENGKHAWLHKDGRRY